MAWTLTHDLDEYVAVAGDFLRSRPVQHTIQLSAVATLRSGGMSAFGDATPLFGWWRPSGGAIAAALFHTPPYPVLLTRLPGNAAAPLAEALVAHRWHVRAVTAEQGDAAAFAAAWRQLTGASARELDRARLFRLGRLDLPTPYPRGRARVAATADRDLVAAWLGAFTAEAGTVPGPPGALDDQLSYGGFTLWEVDAAAVSLAGVRRPAAGVVRVGPVYTPPDQRRKGYAGAVTASVSRAALDAGAADVVLFTDLANPTSNALYQRLGYRPVEDRVALSFGC